MISGEVIDAVSAFAAVGSFVAVAVGVFVARSQLSAWRHEAKNRRRADVAENTLYAIAEADEALRYIRHPLDSIPKEKMSEKREYLLQRRLDRINSKKDAFANLAKSQIAVEIVIGSETVDKAIREIFMLRTDIIVELEFLRFEDIDEGYEKDSRLKEEIVAARKVVTGSYGDRDAVGKRQTEAVEAAKEILLPIARYDVN